MMAVLPVSLGVAFIAIVGHFPFEPWQLFLSDIGLTQVIADFVNITTGVYAIYIVITIAYECAKIEKVSPITPTILSLAFFLILVPQHQMVASAKAVSLAHQIDAKMKEGIKAIAMRNM